MQALWQRLQQLRHDFFLLYLAYHHFRSKVRQGRAGAMPPGPATFALWRPVIQALTCLCPLWLLLLLLPLPQGWIPRTGLQYGADFVLYQRHPALSHSDYTVIIIPLAPGQRPDLGWHDFQISNRLSTQASHRGSCAAGVGCGQAALTWRCHTKPAPILLEAC